MGKIYFWTMSYNNARTLPRCVDSILNQKKYGDKIEYWFCDNGSTDNTRELIEEYAKKDPRIRVFYNEKNMEWTEQSSVFWDLPQLLNDDDLLCFLDTDDYYDLDFLEKMVPFVLENNLDIAMAGSDFFDEITGRLLGQRFIPETLIVDTPEKFINYFPVYHKFTRTIWGKVFSGKTAVHMLTHNNSPEGVWDIVCLSGFDTYMVYSVLMHSSRIGILSEQLHHYQVSSRSGTYRWHTGRFPSAVIQDEDVKKFLEKFGPISKRNHDFLDCVYANALVDCVNVLSTDKGMTCEEKLKELRKGVDNCSTPDMIWGSDPHVLNARQKLFDAALEFGKELTQENEDLKAALKLICPRCAPYISTEDIGLYTRDEELKTALFNDNMSELVERLVALISNGAYSKQFDLMNMLQRFSEDRELAVQINDPGFIKKHSDIYLLIWQNRYARALDKMTETILSNKPLDEFFYEIYMTLAAVLECVDEFLIGKIKLALYYCRRKQFDECRAVLDELNEMGVQDNDDILEIKAALNNK